MHDRSLQHSVIALASLACVIAASHAANAQNVLVNGGFETGDFTGWTQSGNTGSTFVTTSPVHSGHFAAALGPVGSDGFLSQSFATTVGELYDVSFWLNSDGGTPNDFGLTVNFNGTPMALFSSNNLPAQPYTQYNFSAAATQATSNLRFNFRNDPSYLYLDDVSVRDAGPAAVPEPGAVATAISLFGTTALGLAYGRRRKVSGGLRPS